MKINSGQAFDAGTLVVLRDNAWLEKQRVAGKVAAQALLRLQKMVEEKTTMTLLEMSRDTEDFIERNGCQSTFKGYKGFPSGVCISVNRQLVHGIPTDYVLQEADMVSFDLGATFEGAIADTALTVIYGEPRSPEQVRIIKATEEALKKGIEAVAVGKRLGCIGNAIYKSTQSNGYGVITKYGGHGISMTADGIGIPHAPPFVANKAQSNEGVRIQAGMVLAIEPMFVKGSTETWVDKDGWTVWCEAEYSSHSEHSIYIHEDHIEVITDRSKLSVHV